MPMPVSQTRNVEYRLLGLKLAGDLYGDLAAGELDRIADELVSTRRKRAMSPTMRLGAVSSKR